MKMNTNTDCGYKAFSIHLVASHSTSPQDKLLYMIGMCETLHQNVKPRLCCVCP